MGDERFRALLAAPLASLILIVLVCVFAISRPASVGISMPILRLRTPGQHATCDGRWVFVVLKDDGNVEVNLVPVPAQKLSAMVGKLMESRAERVVYLVPSPDVSYSKFVQTLDTLRSSAVDVHVGVLSGSIRDEYLGSKPKLKRTYLPCDIIWPAKEFQAAK